MVKISELIAEAEIKAKCENCKEEFEFTIEKDCFINLIDGSIRIRCPHCTQAYKIEFDLIELKE